MSFVVVQISQVVDTRVLCIDTNALCMQTFDVCIDTNVLGSRYP